jgi:hypothetical protein
MFKKHNRLGAWLLTLALLLSAAGGLAPGASAAAQTPDPIFQRVWERSDRPVAEGRAQRSWTWGPAPVETRQEPYKEAPGGQRQVQYYDKARMEINNPNGDRNNPFFVTNGRLVVEMLSGRIQTGDNQYDTGVPADVPIAGDTPGGHYDTPTYASLYQVANIGGQGQRAPQLVIGTPLRQSLNRAGFIGQVAPGSVPDDNRSTVAIYVPETGHNIPLVFWNFLNQRGPVYENGAYKEDTVVNWVFAFGYPIAEPYWATIKVGGKDYTVLFQAFERRVLTFNPANPAAFQVEMGNVGLHYRDWRYAKLPVCNSLPVRGFGKVWAEHPQTAVNLNCPSEPRETIIQSAVQHFEHGTMVWLNQDTRGGKAIYVLFDDGTFARFDDTWDESQPATHNQNPPAGRYEPVRGFGKVWFEGTGARVRERLGWATDLEKGGAGARQRFNNGSMYWMEPSNQILALYEFTPYGGPTARWQLFNDSFNTP